MGRRIRLPSGDVTDTEVALRLGRQPELVDRIAGAMHALVESTAMSSLKICAASIIPTASASPPRRRAECTSDRHRAHLDQLVSKLTGGKRSFAAIAAGLPSVILTASGAKSGKPRTVALLGIPHPDGVAVVAANYGDAKHPAWYHKLKANPAATVVKCQWVSAT